MNTRSIDTFIFNYNGKNTILTTIESLYSSIDVDVRITVIDDHSTDESLEMIRSKYPEISIHIMPINYKRINVLRNKAIELGKSEYIFITDNDLNFDSRCLIELVNAMDSDKLIAACTPRLMYWDQPEKIYTSGTRVHYIGTSIADNRDKIYSGEDSKPSTNSGGGIILIRLDSAKKVGDLI